MRVTDPLPTVNEVDIEAEADSTLKELGLDTSEEYERKIIIFYNINAIRICDENPEQTSIYANGENYIADLPIHEVKRIINNGISKRIK